MKLDLFLGLIKVGLDVYQDERKDRHLKRYNKIRKEFQDELNKGLEDRSDLVLDQLRIDAEQLAELIVRERIKD